MCRFVGKGRQLPPGVINQIQSLVKIQMFLARILLLQWNKKRTGCKIITRWSSTLTLSSHGLKLSTCSYLLLIWVSRRPELLRGWQDACAILWKLKCSVTFCPSCDSPRLSTEPNIRQPPPGNRKFQFAYVFVGLFHCKQLGIISLQAVDIENVVLLLLVLLCCDAVCHVAVTEVTSHFLHYFCCTV